MSQGIVKFISTVAYVVVIIGAVGIFFLVTGGIYE